MIYGLGQGAPTVCHDSYESAIREAHRLARTAPDVQFYILQSVAVAVKADFEFRKIDLDQIPF